VIHIGICWQVHKKAAEKLLELCCTNRGVYIKVGQHIGALDYLVPPEYVETMKVLHSQAPRSTIEEVYKVLREDLKQDVRLMKGWYSSCMYTFWQHVIAEKLREWFW
jgi:predicted unusual protein kinase regulating ubiquinone biosynthesis (AarF/ABC1/UbiB family)